MSIGKKTSWQLAAVAAAALLSGVVQADGRDHHRGRGDDRGWRQQDRGHGHGRQHSGRDYGRGYDGRHDRGWHHGQRHHNGYRPRHWSPPHHWRHGPPHHRHYYHSYYPSTYWVPDSGGVQVTIGFPL